MNHNVSTNILRLCRLRIYHQKFPVNDILNKSLITIGSKYCMKIFAKTGCSLFVAEPAKIWLLYIICYNYQVIDVIYTFL